VDPQLSHIDDSGKARMVDVGHKPPMRRRATAEGFIRLQPETLELIRRNEIAKGDVLAVARIAGIQAAKETARLIPLCHPLPIDHIDVQAETVDDGIRITATAACVGRTGVEMEAITAATIALVTVYDMCKAVDKSMTIEQVRLVEKTKKEIY